MKACETCGGEDVHGEPLAPAIQTIDEWRSHNGRNGWPSYGVDIRTKSGSWRCVTSRAEDRGHVYYWTIRGEGSSNGGRETAIRASDIVAARGHVLHYAAMENR